MFDKFFDSNVNFIKCLLLTAGIMLALFAHLMYKYPVLKKYEKALNRALIVTGTISILAYMNMGFLHYQGGFFHGYNFFDRYMTSKYFKEVGYLYLNDAAVVADSEDTKFLKDIKQVKDQKDFSLRPVDEVFKDEGRWRNNFSEKSWREFKEDLKFFETKGGMKTFEGRQVNLWWWNWNNILTDYEYSQSPVWESAAYILTNILPVTNKASMILMSFSDVILIFVMAYVLFRGFGISVAALFTIFLCCNYAPFFSWAGNSLLEMDWLALLVFAVCSLKRNDNEVAGTLAGAAACIRPFTAVFALPHILKIISGFIQERKLDAKGAKFLMGYFAAAAALVLLSFIILPNAFSAWGDYFHKIIMISKKLEISHWGFKDIFLWEGEMRGQLANGWEQAKAARLDTFLPVITVIQFAAVGALFIHSKKLSYMENFLLGSVLVFFLFSLGKIYYIYTAFFVLFFSIRLEHTWRIIGIAALFGLNVLMFIILSFQDNELLLKFIYAAGLLGIIGYLFFALDKTEEKEFL